MQRRNRRREDQLWPALPTWTRADENFYHLIFGLLVSPEVTIWFVVGCTTNWTCTSGPAASSFLSFIYNQQVFDQAYPYSFQLYYQCTMGAASLKISPTANANLIDELFSHDNKSNQAISNLLARFTAMVKFEKQGTFSTSQQSMKLTESMVALYWHQSFPTKALFWYRFLKNFLTKLLNKKSMIFVTTDEWRLCLGLSEFVMLCCDESIRVFLNKFEHLTFSQVPDQSGNMTQKKFKKLFNLEPVEKGFSEAQKEQLRDKLRQFIYYSLYAKNKIVPHFSVSFTQINRNLECLLNLYIKLQYECPSLTQVALKRNITTCAYVIGLGIQYDQFQMANLAIKLLLSVLRKSRTEPELLGELQLKPIPAHYFKETPILSCSSLYETIFSYLLHLVCTKTRDIDLPQVFDLLEVISGISRPKNKEIILFFEKACSLQVYTENQQVKLKRLIRNYFKSMAHQSKKIKQFVSKAHTIKEILNIEQLELDGSLTQAGKQESELKSEEAPTQQCMKYSIENMSIIYKMYHESVALRFIPSVNACYKFLKEEQVEIRSPVRFREESGSFSEKTSKKGSEEQSLQAFNQQGNEKVISNFRIEEME